MATPAIKSVKSDPCQNLFSTDQPRDKFRKVPRKVRRQCGREHFNLSKLGKFQFAMPVFFRPSIVKDAARVMNWHSTYRLAEAYYPLLTEPGEGLQYLTERILEMSGKEKVILVLDQMKSKTYTGRAHIGRDGPIIIELAWPRAAAGQVKSHELRTTLYHELGHHLMYLSYGQKAEEWMKIYPRNPGSAHDTDNRTLLQARTSPGAAWVEGFANAMEMIETRAVFDVGSVMGLSDWDAWKTSSLKDKLSNEYVIGSIISTYIAHGQSKIGGVPKFNAAMRDRLNKIITSMQKHGVQKNFQEFVVDFLSDYPEEKARLRDFLMIHGMGKILD